MFEESTTPQADKGGRKQNEIINLTNTDEEIDSNKEKEEDLEKEDSSEESSDNFYGNENSDSSAGSEETSSKEDMTNEGRKEAQEKDESSSKESPLDNEVEDISVSSPTKKGRIVIKESEEDIKDDSNDNYKIPEFNMEHLVEKRMMAKFHDVQVDKLVNLSNFWYVKRTGKSGYNPVALKCPTKEYGDKFKKKLVEKRRRENDVITLVLGGRPTLKGRAHLRKKVTPTKEHNEKKGKKIKSKRSKQV